MGKIPRIIFYFLFFIDKITIKLFKKSYLIFFKELWENNSYTELKILDNKLKFFTPNKTTRWRVDTLFSKEPETIDWINNFDNKSKIVFWDIGSNIGLYSIYASIKFDNINVISFEPSTSNLRILSRNISINNLGNKIKINQLPLSDEANKYETMHESEFIEGYSMHTFGKNLNFQGENINSKNSYKILGTSINYLIENNIAEFPNYIKIDVDGLEHIILNGGLKYLSDQRLRSISVELNENFKDQYNQVLNIMEKSNFKMKQKKRSDSFYNKDQSKVFNYIFEKNEN